MVISVLNGCEVFTRYARASRLVFCLPISAFSVLPSQHVHSYMHLNDHTPTQKTQHIPTHTHTPTHRHTRIHSFDHWSLSGRSHSCRIGGRYPGRDLLRT